MKKEESLSKAEILTRKGEFEKALNLYDELMRELFGFNRFVSSEIKLCVKVVEGRGRVFEAQGKQLAALSEYWTAASYLGAAGEEDLLLRLFSEILSCIHKTEKEAVDIGSNLKDLKTAIVFTVLFKDGSHNRDVRSKFENLMKIACETEAEFEDLTSFVRSMDSGQDNFNRGYKDLVVKYAQQALKIAERLDNEKLSAKANELLSKAPNAIDIYSGTTGC